MNLVVLVPGAPGGLVPHPGGDGELLAEGVRHHGLGHHHGPGLHAVKLVYRPRLLARRV